MSVAVVAVSIAASPENSNQDVPIRLFFKHQTHLLQTNIHKLNC